MKFFISLYYLIIAPQKCAPSSINHSNIFLAVHRISLLSVFAFISSISFLMSVSDFLDNAWIVSAYFTLQIWHSTSPNLEINLFENYLFNTSIQTPLQYEMQHHLVEIRTFHVITFADSGRKEVYGRMFICVTCHCKQHPFSKSKILFVLNIITLVPLKLQKFKDM